MRIDTKTKFLEVQWVNLNLSSLYSILYVFFYCLYYVPAPNHENVSIIIIMCHVSPLLDGS